MFQPVPGSPSFPQLEEETLAFWRERGIYEKSLAAREGAEPFVFYEGPPTANGMPHPGHCLTRAIKDLFPRYKTMRGYRCERKAGWDTHGLPVEVEVCKELGIHSKEEIEAYGVEPFIQKCQASVWRYMKEWERLTERLGFWVNLDEAYVTYHQSYVESVWWSLKQLFDRGLLYQGHKIVWWWAQGGTALSSGEVGQGYREVADPSVYVKFPLLDDDGNVTDTSLLVWTTTPWTLPSNQFVAVNPDIEYVEVRLPSSNERIIVASGCADAIRKHIHADGKYAPTVEADGTVVINQDSETYLRVLAGSELVGKRYKPPFDCFYERTGHHFTALTGDNDDRMGHREGELLEPLADGQTVQHMAWRVVPADFVTTDSGTGVVHQAPAFGEVDYEVLIAETLRFQTGSNPGLINCVAPDGKFTDEAPDFVRGRWVKDCDKDITRDLKQRGLLFHQEQYLHDYPFCWRAEEDPLIQYPRESWFIKTTAFKDAMLENNQAINWLPEHIKGGRMGKFLESNVDWALSRERYWGTPLPVWECAACSRQQAVGSYDELLSQPGVTGTEVWEEAKAKNPELPDDLCVHKPYIDAVSFPCNECGGTMHRVSEVIDCWYDSGAMPFAQWGYKGEATGEPEGVSPGSKPLKSKAAERFQSQFPADFISEALDQTRGWFYSQLAISTMLWGEELTKTPGADASGSPAYPHPFKNCIVLGLMLGEDGQKMSKQKRNYREPNEIFDKYGADALRWYLFANQPPWTSIRYSEQAIKDSIPEFLLRLWNCYSFLVIYANIDGWTPAVGSGQWAGGSEKDELDRWILSELNRTVAAVTERMDAYDNFGACAAITEFVDGLSNWWVRRSRDRFWAKDTKAPAKLDAYATLYECLVTTSKLIAPFTPFLAEAFWRNLATEGPDGEKPPESVHLCDYPAADASLIDEALSERMRLVRLISSLGLRVRQEASLKVRQPLKRVTIIFSDQHIPATEWILKNAPILQEELNVKNVEFSATPEKFVDYQLVPNFKKLGKEHGKAVPGIKKAFEKQGDHVRRIINLTVTDTLHISDNAEVSIVTADELPQKIKSEGGKGFQPTPDDVEVRITAKEGYAAANDKGVVVVLATELTPELVAEGLAQDLKRAIQDRRKDLGCEFTDRIEIGIETDSEELAAAVDQFKDYLAGETLADSLVLGKVDGAEPVEINVGDAAAKLYMQVKK